MHKPDIPLSVAVTTGFMSMGLVDYEKRNCTTDLFETWGAGVYELHFVLAQFAVLADEMVKACVDTLGCDFPGVYDYEVSEPFGAWVAEQIMTGVDFTTTRIGYDHLAVLTAEFFAKGVYDDSSLVFNKGVAYGVIRAKVPVPEVTW